MNLFKNPTMLREAALVFLVVLVAYGYFSAERDVNINSRLALVRAVVDKGRFEIDSYHDAELYTNDKAFFNGHYYSDKAIGASVLGAAVYYPLRWLYYQMDVRLTPRAFREWVTFGAVSLPAALLAPVMYFVLKRFNRDRGMAFLITLGICLGTPLFKYATAFYGHTLAAVFFFLSFAVWFRFREEGAVSLPLTFFSGFLMGFTLITEYPTLVLLLILSLYILFVLYGLSQHRDWKIYASFITGAAIPVVLLASYNLSIYGTPLAVGYLHEADETFREAHSASLLGIGVPDLRVLYYQTLHPAMGIFWQSPILLLGVAGIFFMARERRYLPELVFSVFSILAYILVISGYYMWWGGVSFTPRHLLPALPLFAIPMAFLPIRFLPWILVSGAVSVFQNLLITASAETGLADHLVTIFEGKFIPTYKGTLIYNISLPNVLGGELVNNRGLELLRFDGAMSLTPLIFIEALMIALFFKKKRSRAD